MERLAVGKIGRCFGVSGYVHFHPETNDPARLKKLRKAFLGTTPDDAVEVAVEDVVVNVKGVVLKLSRHPDRTAAEADVGKFLFVDAASARRPRKGEYLVHELIGCAVERPDGTRVGVVDDVLKMPAQDLWAVRRDDGEIVYLPAVKEFVREVHIAARRIVVAPIEGLLEP